MFMLFRTYCIAFEAIEGKLLYICSDFKIMNGISEDVAIE